MLCGVTATLGSNPSATATAARPQWGRAVLLCLNGVWARARARVCVLGPGCLVCPWAAGYLADGVPVGGGPPASRPRRELRSARRLEARPGPAAAHGPRSLALRHPPHRRRLCRCVWLGRRLEARPGPAAAHGPRSLALRHPPHRRRLCRCAWLGASSRSAPVPSVPSGALRTGGACVAVTSPARPCRRPRAPQSTGSTAWPSRSCGALHAGRANPLRGR